MTTPSTKVTAATLATAVAVIGVWALERWTGVGDIPTTVQGAVTILLTFLAGYIMPEKNPAPSARATIANGG